MPTTIHRITRKPATENRAAHTEIQLDLTDFCRIVVGAIPLASLIDILLLFAR